MGHARAQSALFDAGVACNPVVAQDAFGTGAYVCANGASGDHKYTIRSSVRPASWRL